jgi:hypothetical protein
MGAEPWSCFVPYQKDVVAALEVARRQEFAAGNYRMADPDQPPATIEEACQQYEASGTASVLDMIGVIDTPHKPDAESPNIGMVAPLPTEQLVELFGTDKPDHDTVAMSAEIYERLDRGLGVYVVVYDGATPTEIFFAGYSFD